MNSHKIIHVPNISLTQHGNVDRYLSRACVGFLFLFYLYSISFYVNSRSLITRLLVTENVRSYLTTLVQTKEAINPITRSVILFVHPKDAEILELLGDVELQNGRTSAAERFYLQAIAMEPTSVDRFLHYFKIQQNVTKQIELLSYSFLPQTPRDRIAVANTILRQSANRLNVPSLSDGFVQGEQVKEYLAHAYYLFGLEALDNSAENATYLWSLANDIDPSLSYYSVDLASIMYWKYHDTVSALKILRQCQNNVSARPHCLIAEGQLRRMQLPHPGSFGDTILQMMR